MDERRGEWVERICISGIRALRTSRERKDEEGPIDE
jgi:hypothetical protein